MNKEAANLCKQKGIEVFNGELLDASLPNETFDVVNLTQVLEHLHNPSETLKEVHRILKKDGLLIIGVPNFGCFDRIIYGKEWIPLEIPRHLYHFDYGTLKKILEINGFQVTDFRGKGYYMLGLKNLKYFKGEGYFHKLKVLLTISLIKFVLLIISKNRKENFSVLISIYAKK
ncbi:MAG: class I SAM-dependent methyltransferase [Nitrospirae bacterium]|nr:class I SAM-dependent methyltransferase [Nitrospirota bacterium]